MKQTPASAQNYAVRGRRSRCVRFLRRGRVNTPPQGSRRSPATAGSVGRGRATEWTSLPACGEAKDASSARTTASIAFVWSAAMPLPAFRTYSGQKPGPTSSCERFCGNALSASGGAASKGDQSPFEDPPALRGGRKELFYERTTHYEERYQVQYAHGQ